MFYQSREVDQSDQLPGLFSCLKNISKIISTFSILRFTQLIFRKHQRSERENNFLIWTLKTPCEIRRRFAAVGPWECKHSRVLHWCRENRQPSGLYPLYVERQVFCRHDSWHRTSDLQRYETGLLVRSDCNEAYTGQWYFRLVAGMRAARWVPRGGETAYERLTRMRVGGFLFSTGCRGQMKTEND